MAMTQTAPKYGLYLQNGTDFRDTLAAPDRLVEYAVVAEEAGWDGVFVSDMLSNAWNDPWITLAGIASQTEQIRLGTYVTPVPRRQPSQLARDLATLDRLSDGRVILGAGLGAEEDYTTFGESWEPRRLGERYDEALEVITGLWSEGEFSHHGQHFTIEGVDMQPTPIQTPRIPIVVGFWWPNKRPIHRGARWDGIVPFAPSFLGEEGLHGEPVTGSPVEEAQDIMEYYRSQTDELGEVVFPADPEKAPPDFAERCADLGATWLVTLDLLDEGEYDENLKRIRSGPKEGW